MTTMPQRSPDLTPDAYAAWWQRASDAEIEGWPHPEDYAADWLANHPPRQPEATRPPFRGGNAPRRDDAPPRQPEATRPPFRGGNAPRRDDAPPRRDERGQERSQGSGVREQPYVQPKAKASPLVGVFALLIGVPFWFEAARFTRDGWILAINWLCVRLAVPWQVPALDWRVALGAALVLGAAYSRIEARPPLLPPKNWRKDALNRRAWRIERTWQVWAVWLFLIVTDIGSTYVGARNRGQSADELRILRDIATSGAALVGYAILLTFTPDGLIRYGWRVFWRK